MLPGFAASHDESFLTMSQDHLQSSSDSSVKVIFDLLHVVCCYCVTACHASPQSCTNASPQCQEGRRFFAHKTYNALMAAIPMMLTSFLSLMVADSLHYNFGTSIAIRFFITQIPYLLVVARPLGKNANGSVLKYHKCEHVYWPGGLASPLQHH